MQARLLNPGALGLTFRLGNRRAAAGLSCPPVCASGICPPEAAFEDARRIAVAYSSRMDANILFTEATEVVRLQGGQALFLEGDPGEVMYVLITGSAEVLVGDKVIERAGPGTLLGELALIDAAPRAATVVATSECRLVSLNKEQFHALIQGTPYFATEVMKVMADRLRRMDQRVTKKAGTKSARKLGLHGA